MKMSKIIALLLVAVMLLCGCNSGNTNPTTDGTPTEQVYAVKFVDAEGNPVSGVITQFAKKDGSQSLILSEADGTISVSTELFEANFTILNTTAGYKVDKMEHTLSAENMLIVVLNKEEAGNSNPTYTITVVDQNGNPVAGVVVQVCDDHNCQLPLTTDASGNASASYAPSNYHVTLNTLPDGYTSEETEFSFNDKTELTIVIQAVGE